MLCGLASQHPAWRSSNDIWVEPMAEGASRGPRRHLLVWGSMMGAIASDPTYLSSQTPVPGMSSYSFVCPWRLAWLAHGEVACLVVFAQGHGRRVGCGERCFSVSLLRPPIS